MLDDNIVNGYLDLAEQVLKSYFGGKPNRSYHSTSSNHIKVFVRPYYKQLCIGSSISISAYFRAMSMPVIHISNPKFPVDSVKNFIISNIPDVLHAVKLGYEKKEKEYARKQVKMRNRANKIGDLLKTKTNE